MLICLNMLSALALLRHIRRTGELSHAIVCGLPEPDCSPQKRWTGRLFPHELLGLSGPPNSSNKVYVAVPSQELRPRASFFETTIYSSGLPFGSFLQISDNFVIPCPELLFIELTRIMHPAAVELLGHELCGSFSRDPSNPRCGTVTHGLEAVTSVNDIRSFIGKCHRILGTQPALHALNYVHDNAWSSTESVCALLMARPVSESGYELGRLHMNVRQETPAELVQRGCKTSRVPDIVLEDLPVGFNYDGKDHLNLDAIPDIVKDESELRLHLAEVREKYVDDRRRDRELAAQGRVILPIVSEDLYQPDGLDAVVLEALMASERLGGPPSSQVASPQAWSPENARKRRGLLLSLLPGTPRTSLGNY